MDPSASLPGFYGCFEQGTYNPAAAKTAETPIFFLRGICNLETHIMGSRRRTRSEAALITAVIMLIMSIFMQWPGVVGFQNLRLGEHMNMARNVTIV